MNRRHLALALSLGLVGAAPVTGQPYPEAEAPVGASARRPVNVQGQLLADLLRARGRSTRLHALGLFSLGLAFDLEAAGWIPGGRAAVVVQMPFGGDPSASNLGDAQGVDNIEAPPGVRLYEAWYEQRWRNGGASLLAGVRDFSSEFALLTQAAVFVHSSPGLQPDIGQAPPSTYPFTALGLRFAARSRAGAYVSAAVFDGRPAEPGSALAGPFRLHRNDGAFGVIELGRDMPPGEAGGAKLAAGAWVQSLRFRDFAGRHRNGNGGVYAIGEFVRPMGIGGIELGGFLQAGVAESDRNRFRSFVGGGLTVGGRPKGSRRTRWGLAVAHAMRSRAYRDALGGAPPAETAVELTVFYPLGGRLAIQPDLQVVRGIERPAQRTAWLAGIRMTLDF